MLLSQALGWLSQPPRRNFTLTPLLRRGWPEAAGFLAMPTALELGRLPRLIERAIFVVGCLADFVWYNGTPLGILGTSHGLTDALEFLLIVKIVGVLVGLVLQVSLIVVAYVIGGFERLLNLQGQGRRKPIDYELYGPRKDD
jgi:hypothetical protein